MSSADAARVQQVHSGVLDEQLGLFVRDAVEFDVSAGREPDRVASARIEELRDAALWGTVAE